MNIACPINILQTDQNLLKSFILAFCLFNFSALLFTIFHLLINFITHKSVSIRSLISFQYLGNITIIIIKEIMGGNAFEDTEPLTPYQYEQIVKQIEGILTPFCDRLEPYIPLPQKLIHGDVDFLLILKEGQTIDTIREVLSIDLDKFIKNNNMTANSVYHKKQVDFNLCKDDREFELCRFYKSYGGIGAFLGLFLPSKFVKLNEDGLFCCAYRQHIKMEFLVSDCIQQILFFYGIDPSLYHQGFKTRIQLFEYLRNIRFLHEQSFVKMSPKHCTKLMKAFQDYLIAQTPKMDQKVEKYEDPIRQTLNYFKKTDEFESEWIKKLQAQKVKQQRQNKWNGMHIMKIFNINSKSVNSYKQKFEKSFQDRTEYEQYIQKSSFQEIVQLFSKVCDLKAVQQ